MRSIYQVCHKPKTHEPSPPCYLSKQQVRVRVAAHVLQMKTHLDDFSSTGVRQLHEEITELAERAGFHFKYVHVYM